jgi:hypothetical protein
MNVRPFPAKSRNQIKSVGNASRQPGCRRRGEKAREAFRSPRYGGAKGKLAWGDYCNWDPKKLWSLVSWLMFLGYFHFRHLFGTRFAGVNVVFLASGLLASVIALFWVNLARVFAGLHSYAA